MKSIILKSKGLEQYRFGSGSKDSTSNYIYSDTLFSALINVYNKIYDDCESIIELFNTGHFKISSAFLVLENIVQKKYIYFIPKPLIEFDSILDSKNSKEFKKTKYISLEVYNLICKNISVKNGIISTNLNFNDKSQFSIIDDMYCILKNEIDCNLSGYKPIANVTLPKVFVNTEQTTDKFYHETNILLNTYYNNGEPLIIPHFYFLMYCDELDTEIYKKIISALRVLCDEGIGGERSTGKGGFKGIEIIDFEMNIIKSDYFMSLSLINPLDQSEFNKCVFYDLIKRGGGSLGQEGNPDYHRKQVTMISEGSIINGNINGRLTDISPNKNPFTHKIYKNGKSFLIPLGGTNGS